MDVQTGGKLSQRPSKPNFAFGTLRFTDAEQVRFREQDGHSVFYAGRLIDDQKFYPLNGN
jgi:hypothetical protein